MTPAQRRNFQRLLEPRHIAFIGGSDAAVAIGEARRIGFSGDIWPVNPKRESIGGLPCFKNLEALPCAPDATFLAIPVAQAIETVRKLNTMGAGGIVCYTAGFKEAGAEGNAAEAELIDAAGDTALIGPNCYGVINYLSRTALWPFAHGPGASGHGCAIITQSGMLSSDITMSQRSVPITHMISIGNQAVLSIEDMVEFLSEDDRVRAIGVHIEGLRDVSAFADAALKATRMGKPVIALKTGSSKIGQALTSSHTGSLSGEDNLYDALFERVGIMRVHSPVQLLETLKFACIAGRPAGNRVAGFTCSGGGATMLADHGEKINLNFAGFSPTTSKQLRRLLPPIATVSNPLDYTTPIWGQPEYTKPVFANAMGDGFDMAILVQDYPAPGLDESRPVYLADGIAFAEAALEAGIPAAICSTIPENMDRDTREQLARMGVAPMQGIHEALDSMAAVSNWAKTQAKMEAELPPALHNASPPANPAPIDEASAKKMLQNAGVNVPAGIICSKEEASCTAEKLGFPLVLKIVHEDLLHKTEAGAVKLGLESEVQVTEAVDAMVADVRRQQPGAMSDLFLLERMQPAPLAELIVSIRRDAQFGLAMTLGSGGILVELVADSKTLLLPATLSDIRSALEGLRVSKLLAGYRGKSPADLEKIAQEILNIARFAEQHKDRVVEVELNPVFVHEDGLCAVDALIHIDNATDQ